MTLRHLPKRIIAVKIVFEVWTWGDGNVVVSTMTVMQIRNADVVW